MDEHRDDRSQFGKGGHMGGYGAQPGHQFGGGGYGANPGPNSGPKKHTSVEDEPERDEPEEGVEGPPKEAGTEGDPPPQLNDAHDDGSTN